MEVNEKLRELIFEVIKNQIKQNHTPYKVFEENTQKRLLINNLQLEIFQFRIFEVGFLNI